MVHMTVRISQIHLLVMLDHFMLLYRPLYSCSPIWKSKNLKTNIHLSCTYKSVCYTEWYLHAQWDLNNDIYGKYIRASGEFCLEWQYSLKNSRSKLCRVYGWKNVTTEQACTRLLFLPQDGLYFTCLCTNPHTFIA